MYLVLFGQKDVNNAGILPWLPTRWAKYCEGMSVADVETAVTELEEHRFVFVDTDTDELLIRTFIRGDGVIKQPNVFKNALKCAELIESERLRRVLASELRGLRRRDAEAVADRIDPNPSETLTEGFENPSETLPEPLNPSGTPREPRGEGVGEGEKVPTADRELGGRAHAYTHTRARETIPPSPHCSKHPDGTDAPCRPCGLARHARAEWDAAQLAAEKHAQSEQTRLAAEARAHAIANCDLCDPDGYIGITPCDHDPDFDDRFRQGMAKARAAITQPKRGAA